MTMDSRLEYRMKQSTSGSQMSPTKDSYSANNGTYSHPYGGHGGTSSSHSTTAGGNHHLHNTHHSGSSSAETPFLAPLPNSATAASAASARSTVALEDPSGRKLSRFEILNFPAILSRVYFPEFTPRRHHRFCKDDGFWSSASAVKRRCSWRAAAIFFVVLAVVLSAALAYVTASRDDVVQRR